MTLTSQQRSWCVLEFHKTNSVVTAAWGSENPHANLKVERDSPKLNVFCSVSKRTVYGPFIFEGQTVTGRSYLEMLTIWLIPQQAAEDITNVFSKMGSRRTSISLSAHLSRSTCQRDGLAALDKMTRCFASGPRDHRTWPFVTFSFGGTWRTESMYLHYPQPWISCRNASPQL